jgi:hypothetical protein
LSAIRLPFVEGGFISSFSFLFDPSGLLYTLRRK